MRFDGPIGPSATRTEALDSYVRRLAGVPGITGAAVTGLEGASAKVDLAYAPSPNSPRAEAMVAGVRDVPAPVGAQVLVGGQTAQLVDSLSSLSRTLPWMALVVLLATFVMLFLAFGSVILPLKAIVMNLISLTVMFGILVWIFQQGHLSGALQFTPNGTIDPTTPILMFAIMFGLSMDYEVFLISRMREHYMATGDNTEAVAVGLQRTGGIITSAALLLMIVVGPFALSGVTFTKMMGIGMLAALLIDATVIRLLLVPATMKLLGDANWWAPAPLRRAPRQVRDGRGCGSCSHPGGITPSAARAGGGLSRRWERGDRRGHARSGLCSVEALLTTGSRLDIDRYPPMTQGWRRTDHG